MADTTNKKTMPDFSRPTSPEKHTCLRGALLQFGPDSVFDGNHRAPLSLSVIHSSPGRKGEQAEAVIVSTHG